MTQITLELQDENTDALLNILENLKDGLIYDIEIKTSNKKRARYQPNHNTIINEVQKPTGKYISSTEYKQKLQ